MLATNAERELDADEREQATEAHARALTRAGLEPAPRAGPLEGHDIRGWLASVGIVQGPAQVCRRCKASYHGPPGICWECDRAADAAADARRRRLEILALIDDEFADYSECAIGSKALMARLKTAEAQAHAANFESLLVMPRLAFVGPAGSGKTSLIVALSRTWVDRHLGQPARIVIASDLANAKQQFKLGQGDPQIVDDAEEARLLVIDDLGNEEDVARNSIKEVLQHRFNKTKLGFQTWITCAFSPKQMRARYGDGITRRVFGECTFRFGAKATDE